MVLIIGSPSSSALHPARPVPASYCAVLMLMLVGLLSFSPLHQMSSRSEMTTLPGSPGDVPDLSNLSLSFLPNAGQWHQTVQFQAQGSGETLLFLTDEVIIAPPVTDGASIQQLRLHFEGANPQAQVIGSNSQPGVTHYLLGNDPARWHTDIPTYAGVVYEQLYSGIDLHYEGMSGSLKSTYTVAPGADPAQIRWRYPEAQRVHVVPGTGDLHITLANGQMYTEHAPIAWQVNAGQRVPVVANYRVAEDGSIGFVLGSYNAALPLVIDPTLDYGTYLGGTAYDAGMHITVDQQGNAYVLGRTISTNFPLRNPAQGTYYGGIRSSGGDLFVAKLNATGTALLFSTYLGGSADELTGGIAVDDAGQVYISGSTNSNNFPLTQALDATFGGGLCDINYPCFDAFVAKLNANGNTLLYSTYLGGSDQDQAVGIGIDTTGNAYVAGRTHSTDFPTVNALQPTISDPDAFVAKLNPTGSALIYSTYLGGSSSEIAWAQSVDPAGHIYLVGTTFSEDFPVFNAYQDTYGGDNVECGDAFVTKLSPDGRTLVYSTYLGKSGSDCGLNIAIDDMGSAYVAGVTDSEDFPLRNPVQTTRAGGRFDIFVTKFNASGNALVYSTYFGSSENDNISALVVDNAKRAYLSGTAGAPDLPPAAPVLAPPGDTGMFLAALAAEGNEVLFNLPLGGMGLALDSQDALYITGSVDATHDLPVTRAYQTELNADRDAFVLKLSFNTTSTGELAFVSSRFGNADIFVMQADGSNQSALTTSSAQDFAPDWSPDGANIAFVSWRENDADNEVYVMEPDGSDQTRLTNSIGGDLNPDWSPDGTQIVFHSYRENGGIMVMNADGSNQMRLIDSPTDDWKPVWSPDGSRIAIQSWQGDFNSDIVIHTLDGTALRNLTKNDFEDRDPAWSPDGTRLTFATSAGHGGNLEIYVIDADGSNLTRLTYHPDTDYMPTWSPDGTRLAFTSSRDGDEEIYVINADGSGLARLTDNDVNDWAPDWKPAASDEVVYLPLVQQ